MEGNPLPPDGKAGLESGLGREVLADALEGVALIVIQGQKFEAGADALNIADDGAHR